MAQLTSSPRRLRFSGVGAGLAPPARVSPAETSATCLCVTDLTVSERIRRAAVSNRTQLRTPLAAEVLCYHESNKF